VRQSLRQADRTMKVAATVQDHYLTSSCCTAEQYLVLPVKHLAKGQQQQIIPGSITQFLTAYSAVELWVQSSDHSMTCMPITKFANLLAASKNEVKQCAIQCMALPCTAYSGPST
jgi:hypothetical protein